MGCLLSNFCVDKLRNQLFQAGAGDMGNYDECSFGSVGKGTFRSDEDVIHLGLIGGRNTVEEEKIRGCFYER